MTPEEAASLRRVNHHIGQLLSSHIAGCDQHPEHALGTDGTVRLCCLCDEFSCHACGATELLRHPFEDIFSIERWEDPRLVAWLCATIKQGDAFNQQHARCHGGHNQHVH